MADKKKDDKKPAAAPHPFPLFKHLDETEFIIAIIAILLFGNWVYFKFIAGTGSAGFLSHFTVQNLWSAVSGYVPFFLAVSFLAVLALVSGIVYCSVESGKMLGKVREKLFSAPIPKEKLGSAKWEKILQHANSNNPNDWKIAIIDADIILDDLLEHMQYHGDTIGDKLKSVEESDFPCLNEAWEAHKFRNQIAHEGDAMDLNERKVKEVIGLYEKVFKDVKYIM